MNFDMRRKTQSSRLWKRRTAAVDAPIGHLYRVEVTEKLVIQGIVAVLDGRGDKSLWGIYPFR
jgi:hypothetical protein